MLISCRTSSGVENGERPICYRAVGEQCVARKHDEHQKDGSYFAQSNAQTDRAIS